MPAAGGGAAVFAGGCATGVVAAPAVGAAPEATGRFTMGAPGVSTGAAARAGGAAGVAEVGGGAGFAGAAAAGFTAAFAAGAAGAASACTDCREMAFSTSPGLAIPERSILVLISPGRGRAAGLAPRAASCAASACTRKCSRTFTASSGSMELECVFFSATPIFGRRSRISLLLTSSSRARSLMRTLSIPACVLSNDYMTT